jgi:hypothetical protein
MTDVNTSLGHRASSSLDEIVLARISKLTDSNCAVWVKDMESHLTKKRLFGYVDGKFAARKLEMVINKHFNPGISAKYQAAQILFEAPGNVLSLENHLSAVGLTASENAVVAQYETVGIDVKSPTILWWSSLDPEKKDEYQDADLQTKNIIMDTLSTHIRQKVIVHFKDKEATAEDVWKYLKQTMKKPRANQVIALLTEAVMCKCGTAEDPLAYVDRVADIQEKARVTGIKIVTDYHPQFLVAGLIDAHPAVHSLYVDREDLNVDMVTEPLARISQEMKKKAGSGDQACVSDDVKTHPPAAGQKRKLHHSFCSFCGSRGHSADLCFGNPEGSSYDAAKFKVCQERKKTKRGAKRPSAAAGSATVDSAAICFDEDDESALGTLSSQVHPDDLSDISSPWHSTE